MMQRQREADVRQQSAAEERRIREDFQSAEAAGRRSEQAADIIRWQVYLCADAQLWDTTRVLATAACCYLLCYFL